MITTVVMAPTTMGIASREDFRRQAMEAPGRLAAADERKTFRRRGFSEELRFRLTVPRLDDRFVIEATAAT
jgi:hypothetical protein